MATDLSDLSELEPGGTDPISDGDDEIRKSRLHTKNWAGIEHQLTGEHKFPRGTDAGRPSAGHANRIYINSEFERMERDTGSTWEKLRNATIVHGETLIGVALPTASPTAVFSVTYTAGGKEGLLILARLTITPAAAEGILSFLTVDGAASKGSTVFGSTGAFTQYYTQWGLFLPGTLAAGTRTIEIKLQATTVGGTVESSNLAVIGL
jgi:hypothetical protein